MSRHLLWTAVSPPPALVTRQPASSALSGARLACLPCGHLATRSVYTDLSGQGDPSLSGHPRDPRAHRPGITEGGEGQFPFYIFDANVEGPPLALTQPGGHRCPAAKGSTRRRFFQVECQRDHRRMLIPCKLPKKEPEDKGQPSHGVRDRREGVTSPLPGTGTRTPALLTSPSCNQCKKALLICPLEKSALCGVTF